MTSKFGSYCRAQRIAKGLKLSHLAAAIGYRNITKGANRLHKLERGEDADSAFIGKVVDALEIDPVVAKSLMRQDHDEALRRWNEWADEPIRPYLVERCIPGIYVQNSIPDDHLADLRSYAQEFARNCHNRVCLVVSRRLSVWIAGDGSIEGERMTQPGVPNVPYMGICGGNKSFLFVEEDKQQGEGSSHPVQPPISWTAG